MFVRYSLSQNISVNLLVNLNSPHWPGYSPLHFAYENKNVKTAELLLQHGTDIYVENGNGSSPLHIAFTSCKTMVYLLLSA